MLEQYFHNTIEPPEIFILKPSDNCGFQNNSSVNPKGTNLLSQREKKKKNWY